VSALLQFLGHPTALRVWAEWRRKQDIIANIDPAEAESIIGPAPVVVDRATGHEQRTILLGQPTGLPFQDHLLMLFAEQIEMPSGADSSTAIFMGGWDTHENRSPETARMLVFMYPILD
jgi:hypothetical protein